jgi:hypothetical protein
MGNGRFYGATLSKHLEKLLFKTARPLKIATIQICTSALSQRLFEFPCRRFEKGDLESSKAHFCGNSAAYGEKILTIT